MGMIGNTPYNGIVRTSNLAPEGTDGQLLASKGPSQNPTYQDNPPAFAAGTAMLFVQTAAPTGWTKSTSHNDKALRVVSGTAGSGGASAFSSVFASRTPGGSVSVSGSVGSTTLDSNMIPGHSHLGGAYRIWDGASGAYGSAGVYSVANPSARQVGTNNCYLDYTSSTGGGGSHNHSFSGSGLFTGTAMDFSVQYVDSIIAVKA